MEWDDEKTISLIDLYRINELLWNPKHAEHRSRPKRFDALNEIANRLNTNVTEIERKIKNVTCQYYRERKKMADAKKSGTGADNVYQSKWFAFGALNFLQSKNHPTVTTDLDTPPESQDPRLQHNDSPQTSTDDIVSQTNKRLKKNPNNEIISEALNIIRSVSQRQTEIMKDEDALFGDYIAAKLRKMDKSTNAVARHRINNIIFEAETGYRSEMFLDYASPASSRSLRGYTGSPNDQTNVYPSNYSSSVYSTVTSPDPPSPVAEAATSVSLHESNSSQDTENAGSMEK